MLPPEKDVFRPIWPAWEKQQISFSNNPMDFPTIQLEPSSTYCRISIIPEQVGVVFDAVLREWKSAHNELCAEEDVDGKSQVSICVSSSSTRIILATAFCTLVRHSLYRSWFLKPNFLNRGSRKVGIASIVCPSNISYRAWRLQSILLAISLISPVDFEIAILSRFFSAPTRTITLEAQTFFSALSWGGDFQKRLENFDGFHHYLKLCVDYRGHFLFAKYCDRWHTRSNIKNVEFHLVEISATNFSGFWPGLSRTCVFLSLSEPFTLRWK